VSESSREAEAVLAANEAFYAAFNQKDLDAMGAAWAKSDDIGCIHPGWNLLRGRDEVMQSWRNILANPEQPRLVVGGASVFFLGDGAIVLCRELVGGAPLAATNIFVREAGAWKLLHHHSGPVAIGA
jgi:ketosteroid isomerase-like protein